jgi:CO/xanthine dehydrogenase Mo-binding subunit
LNERNLRGQTSGGLLQGMSQARFEKWAYDLRWGVNQNRRLHTAKPIAFPNIPQSFTFSAVGIPDRETPVGSRGVGEPPVGAGGGVIVSAIQDALGVYVGRTPVTPDRILNALEGAATGYSAVQNNV